MASLWLQIGYKEEEHLRMPLILLILCGVCIITSEAEMNGGQALTGFGFSESVYIQNKAAPHEALCLGSIFNSFTVFTADTCKVDEKSPSSYRVMPAVQASAKDFDVSKAKAFDVINVTTYQSSNLSGIFRVKIIRIGIPGMIVPVDGSQANFITTWDDMVDIIVYNHTGIGAAMSYSLPPKAGAIHFEHPDTMKCNSTYATEREQDWPLEMHLSHFCIFKSDQAFNSSVGEIVPGMPCEDSVGSPIFTSDRNNYRIVIGILLVSKCTAATPFAVGINSADFTSDFFYTPTPSSPPPTTSKFTRPSPETTQRPPFPGFTTRSKTHQKPASKGVTIVVYLPTLCAAIFTSASFGL